MPGGRGSVRAVVPGEMAGGRGSVRAVVPVKKVFSVSAQSSCILLVFKHFKSHRKLQKMLH
jgi:hypothetical protein